MRAVPGRDTSPEIKLRKSLWARGLRYRKHQRVAATRPDVCFVGPRIAVFVDGCFWHGCPRHYTAPKTRQVFWETKLRRNRERDKRNSTDLEGVGWTVRRYWECEIDSDVEAIALEIESLVRRSALK